MRRRVRALATRAALGASLPALPGPLLALAASLLVLAGCGSGITPSTTAATSTTGHKAALVAIGAGLDGPAGLKATVYAKGPATTAAFAFDRQGRLWLTAAGLETHPRDGVYLIAKPGAAALKVISGLSDPLGLSWRGGTLYVASLGRVDAFAGFDGRRFNEHKEILDGPVAGGENNLLVSAPDGRLTMGVTATCDHCTPKSKWSGAIVSFRPDGSDLRLFARSIRAPVGLAYYPGTSDLLVTMNQRDDLGARTPGDWLAQVKEGEDWGFPDCYGQGGAACAGVPAPIAQLDKHAAVGGLAIVTGQLGPAVGTSAVVAEWQTGRVQAVALTKTGSTYKGSVSPLLTGIHNPLAVALAGEDSLLIGDWSTGTIYRIAKAGSSG